MANITINNFVAEPAKTYTAEILENPTYDAAKNAAFFQARMNGKEVVRLALRSGTLNAFLEQADGKATEKADGGYDFRGLKVTGRGNVATTKDGYGKFLNMGYILKVEAKADPAPKAIAAPAAQAKAPDGFVAVAGYNRRLPQRKANT